MPPIVRLASVVGERRSNISETIERKVIVMERPFDPSPLTVMCTLLEELSLFDGRMK